MKIIEVNGKQALQDENGNTLEAWIIKTSELNNTFKDLQRYNLSDGYKIDFYTNGFYDAYYGSRLGEVIPDWNK